MKDTTSKLLVAVFLVAILVLWLACDSGENVGEHEGDDFGECRDGADNDRDGLFDCDDNDCTGSSDCEGADGDGDADVDTDTDADGDYDVVSDGDTDLDDEAVADGDADPDEDRDVDGDGEADWDLDEDFDGRTDAEIDIESDSDSDVSLDADYLSDADHDTDDPSDADVGSDGDVHPIQFEGTYELENLFDFGDNLPPSVSIGLGIFDELTDDHGPDRNPQDDVPSADDMCGQDPGAFLTDFVMRQMCGWECLGGEDFDDCSEINHALGDLCLLYGENFQSWDGAEQGLPGPLIGGCGIWENAAVPVQRMINEEIEGFVPSFSEVMPIIIGDLVRAINRANIFSQIVLEEEGVLGVPFTHTLTEMFVRLRDFEGGFHEYRFDLADVGLSSLADSGTADVSGTLLTLPEHSFTLHFGELVHYIYVNGLLPVLGFDSTAAMFSSWVDCNAVAETLHGWFDDVYGFSPGVGSLRGYCDSGITSAGRAVENHIARAVDDDGTLVINGHVTGDDITEEGLVQTLTDGEWSGQWTEGAESGDIAGIFMGVHP